MAPNLPGGRVTRRPTLPVPWGAGAGGGRGHAGRRSGLRARPAPGRRPPPRRSPAGPGWPRTTSHRTWRLRIGSSAIVVRTPSAILLVDPWLAFDDPARLAPRLAALRAAGHRARGDRRGDQHPRRRRRRQRAGRRLPHLPQRPLPRAPRPSSTTSRAGVHPEQPAGSHRERPSAARARRTRGWLDGINGRRAPPAGRPHRGRPRPQPGHVVVWITSGGRARRVVAGPPVPAPGPDRRPRTRPTATSTRGCWPATRRRLLRRCVEEDALLLGPLFAAPGGGRVRPDGASWRLVPA